MTYTAIIAIGDGEYIRKSFYDNDLCKAREWATTECKKIGGRWAQVVDKYDEIYFYIDHQGALHDYSDVNR